MGRKKKEEGVIDIIEKKKEKKVNTENKIDFISTGSTNLNLAISNALNKGYPVGKIINIVGDKSTGKTLLAIEVINYMLHKFKKSHDIRVRYVEAEAAFDKPYAKELGLSLDDIEFVNDEKKTKIETVEGLHDDIDNVIKEDNYDAMIYIVDSLDALSSKAEMERDNIDKNDYDRKPKKMSELLRKKVRDIRKKNILLIIISQIRDKMNVTFGETKTRAGGRALDFYASVVIWLYEKKKITRSNIPVGIEIKAKIKKNKVWKPFREANFSILFGYGIDDLNDIIDFLTTNKYLLKTTNGYITYGKKQYYKDPLIRFIEENNLEAEFRNMAKQCWDKLEEDASVKRKPKYEV